jgi:glycerol-3-phosphate dehydrogenase
MDGGELFSSVVPPEFDREAVAYYCRNEWVVHLDDLLLRRTSWHFYEKDVCRIARQAAQWMAEHLEWDGKRVESELLRYSQQTCLEQFELLRGTI